jgi:hypothetical protein
MSGVQIGPGATPFTLRPLCINCFDSERVKLAEHVGAEGALELLIRQVLETLAHVLQRPMTPAGSDRSHNAADE